MGLISVGVRVQLDLVFQINYRSRIMNNRIMTIYNINPLVRVGLDKLTFPLRADFVAGYMKMPPYLMVLCTSATMEPTYRAP